MHCQVIWTVFVVDGLWEKMLEEAAMTWKSSQPILSTFSLSQNQVVYHISTNKDPIYYIGSLVLSAPSLLHNEVRSIQWRTCYKCCVGRIFGHPLEEWKSDVMQNKKKGKGHKSATLKEVPPRADCPHPAPP